VGWAGQLKRWEVVWGATLQEGQRPTGDLSLVGIKVLPQARVE